MQGSSNLAASKKRKIKHLGRSLDTALQALESAWVWLSNASISPVHPDEPAGALLCRGCSIEDQLNNLWDAVHIEVMRPLIQKARSVKIVEYEVFSSLLQFCLSLSRPVTCLVFRVCSLMHGDPFG